MSVKYSPGEVVKGKFTDKLYVIKYCGDEVIVVTNPNGKEVALILDHVESYNPIPAKDEVWTDKVFGTDIRIAAVIEDLDNTVIVFTRTADYCSLSLNVCRDFYVEVDRD